MHKKSRRFESMNKPTDAHQDIGVGSFYSRMDPEAGHREISISLTMNNRLPLKITRTAGPGRKIDAEYEAAILLFETAIDNGCLLIRAFGEDKSVILGMTTQMNIKDKLLMPMVERVRCLISCFYECEIVHHETINGDLKIGDVFSDSDNN